MVGPILMNVIEAFFNDRIPVAILPIRSCGSPFFKRNSRRGRGSLKPSVRPIHHEEGGLIKDLFMQMIKSFCFP